MRRALLLGLALAMLMAAPAHAGWRIDRSVEIAETVWHPACGQLKIVFQPPAPGDGDIATAGWALAGDCTIGLNSTGAWPETWHSFGPLCDTILHEAGHAAGMGHSSNPRSIMYPYRSLMEITETTRSGRTITRWDGLDRRCVDRGRPFLERHGLLASAGHR